MSPIHVPLWQVEQRVRERPSEYLAELKPALLEVCPNGTHVYDRDHPAWRLAVHKYSPRADLTGYDPDTSPESPRFGGCCDPSRVE